MALDRRSLYKFPWSKGDNPGAWIEVTDRCDLYCPGCYRHRLEGDRPVEDVKRDILTCQALTNCGRISIAGGEPLLYPHLAQVVEFIARQGMDPVIFTNGERLDRAVAAELKKAGVHQFFVHIDSGQRRPGWEGKTEAELNALRQRYADLISDLGKVRCGMNVTLTRQTFRDVPLIVNWATENIDKVQNVSLIPLRGLDLSGGRRYAANGRTLDLSPWQSASSTPDELTMTSDEIYETVRNARPELRASAYLSGTAFPETTKFLVILPVGSPGRTYGVIGGKSVEVNEILHHLRKGHYAAGPANCRVGKRIFVTGLFDREIRRALLRFTGAVFRNPALLVKPVFVQCINIQQPNEIIAGEVNLCDGCLNQMVYHGELIPSCKLDEYRLYGGPIIEITPEAETIARSMSS
ncbi:MAG: radical SAM protein [Candidatus Aminicenantes bacterium]|nr:radical SAM protein [Candidatus Aminicenantes bacterium]